MTLLLKFWRPIAIVVGIFIVSLLLGKFGTNNELDTYIKNYNAYRDSVQTTLLQSDSVKIQLKELIDSIEVDSIKAKIQTGKIATLKSSLNATGRITDSLQRQLDSLKHASVVDSAGIIKKQDQMIDTLKSQVSLSAHTIQLLEKRDTSRVEQITHLSRALTLSISRGDSLEVKLRNLPKPPKNPDKLFGIIQMPSRTVVGIVSFTAGVVVGFVAKH